MFCPVCESEYEEGVTRCAEHGVDLVERLSPDNSHDASEARFTPLHNVGSPAEAEMINDILRQNGVRTAVQSGGSDMFSPLLSTSAPGAVVLVDERDYDRALEIYKSFFGSDTTPLTGTTIAEDEGRGEDEDDDTEDALKDD